MEDNKLCLEKQPLSDELLNKMNAYWRAANLPVQPVSYTFLIIRFRKMPLTMDQIKKKNRRTLRGTVPWTKLHLCTLQPCHQTL